MHQIEKHYQIALPLERVWAALTDTKEINAWGGGPVKFDLRVGGEFGLWDGDIYGMNTEVIAPKLLAQDWYGGKWDKPSRVEFHLTKKGSGTELVLYHDGLPKEEVADFDSGWDDYYLGAIKKYLEK